MFKMGLVWMGVVGLVLCAGMAFAAVNITNTCTGLFEVTGLSPVASGIDTAVGRRQTSPYTFGETGLLIAKSITNLRSGQSDPNQVNMLSGDTIEFTIVWSNGAEATADTIVLTDYVPSGMTYVANSLSDTEANCSSGSVSINGNKITYTATGVAGTDPGPNANGIFKFRATVD